VRKVLVDLTVVRQASSVNGAGLHLPGHEDMQRIVLASGSPRRRVLLEQIGVRFEVLPSGTPELTGANAGPEEHVQRAAVLKAWGVAQHLEPEAILIAADTVVCIDGALLGKPSDEAQAAKMLRRLSGRAHTVYTGLAVGRAGDVPKACPRLDQWRRSGLDTDLAATWVKFRRLSPAEIRSYVETGEPLDKAGAYAIQGRGALLVEEIRGCYFNVVGLPLVKLAGMLARFGIRPL